VLECAQSAAVSPLYGELRRPPLPPPLVMQGQRLDGRARLQPEPNAATCKARIPASATAETARRASDAATGPPGSREKTGSAARPHRSHGAMTPWFLRIALFGPTAARGAPAWEPRMCRLVPSSLWSDREASPPKAQDGICPPPPIPRRRKPAPGSANCVALGGCGCGRAPE